MKLTEFMDERYNNRKDKDNMFGVGVSDAEFRAFIIDYLLGEDWYVADPLGQIQINEIALYEILKKYSKRYKKECRNRKRGKRMTIETVIKSVCEKCKFYDKSFGVCTGEVLPVERAILNNAEGRGLCDNIKNFITKGESE